jgi:Protein phosphatase 2C
VPWKWASATCQGTSHVRDGVPCQDNARCIAVGAGRNILVAVVSDGAGSAQFGGQGSALVARTITERARDHFSTSEVFPTDEEIWTWIDLARDRIGAVAGLRSSELRQFASTLVAVIASDTATLILHIGDGAPVVRIEEEWKAPSWPANGEYASTTFFVTDEPAPQLRLTRIASGADAVAVFSDGLERLALKFSDTSAHSPFFESVFKPIWSSAAQGCNPALAESLKRYLNSAPINERTDDDKSLILASRT